MTDLNFINHDGQEVKFELDSPDENPEEKVVTKERNEKIENILNKMKNKSYVNIIRMRFYEDMSYMEIVQRTGKPLGTVKGIIFRAKEILKQEFEKQNISLI
jgi:RNA polymerase sigma-70 factor (ECF subfamily)